VNNQSTPLSIPGDIEVFYGTLFLNGSFNFAGGLISDASYIVSIGQSIAFGDEVALYGRPSLYDNTTIGYPSTWNLSNTLSTPKLTLYNETLLRASGNLQINGDFNNLAGIVQIDQNQFIFVSGNYYQGEKANVSFIALDNSFNSTFNTTARLAISRDANIGGRVQYTYSQLPKNAKYPILQVINGTIKGQFAQKATSLNSASINTLDFDYNTQDFVYVVYSSSSPKKLGPLVWYYWIVIGVGALIVIGLIVFIAVRASKGKGYAAIAK